MVTATPTVTVYGWDLSIPLATISLNPDGPTPLDLHIYRGDSFYRTFIFKNADGSPISLSGGWLAQIRADEGATDPLATFYLNVNSGDSGVVKMELDPTTTTTLTGGVWDLQGDNDDVRTWLAGRVTVTPDASRDGVETNVPSGGVFAA